MYLVLDNEDCAGAVGADGGQPPVHHVPGGAGPGGADGELPGPGLRRAHEVT